VFASAVGTPLDDHNVRRQLQMITEAAELGKTWVPRELRHTFVSLLSAHAVSAEEMALVLTQPGATAVASTPLLPSSPVVVSEASSPRACARRP
jgi:site-specific recombinase XerC